MYPQLDSILSQVNPFHTTTYNTDMCFVSADSEATTLLHSHMLLRRMRGGEDDDDVQDDHMIKITDQFARY
jgi:hypothetical protein